MVDICLLPAHPLQPDFEQGTYAETTHTLIKSCVMYTSDWSNDLTYNHFMSGSMLLSWDVMPNDSDGVAYLFPRCLDTMKASLIFAKPLPANTTLIAYAEYDNLMIVDT